MQRLLSITAFPLVLASGVSVPQVSAKPVAESLISRGHPQSSRPSSAQPSEKQTQPTSESEAVQQSQNNAAPTSRDQSTSERKENTVVPGYCVLPPNVVEGSFQYHEELHNCKYGL